MLEQRSTRQQPRGLWRAGHGGAPRSLILVVLPLATGVGLVLTILTGVPLVVGIVAVAVLGAAGLAWYVRQLTPPARRDLGHRARVAVVAGIAATVLYDVSRLVVARTLTPAVDPFEAWPVFGQLIIGDAHGSGLTLAVGAAFHVTNGICFGIAYVLLVRRPGLVTGVAWGLGLELAMALLYPSWLRIQALQEFLTLSVVGHVVYGATLGLVAGHLLTSPRRALPGSAP